MGNMQTQNKLIESGLNALQRASTWLSKMANRILIWLQAFYEWLQTINWPKIPLNPFQWVILFFVIFAVAYAFSTPIFEAGDELKHFARVNAIAQGEALLSTGPDATPEALPALLDDTRYQEVALEPPLYYQMAALLVSPVDTSNLNQFTEANPFVNRYDPFSTHNKNLLLHEQIVAPLEGTPVAVYALRLLNIAFIAVTIWAVFRTGRLLAPQRRVTGLVAAALVAFNPMVLFVATSVNNLPLVMMLSSIAVYLTFVTLREGFAPMRSGLIALTLALATLTHVGGFVILLTSLGAGAWAYYRKRDTQGFLIFAGASVALVLVTTGWWYLSNLQQYGDLFAVQQMGAVAGAYSDPFGLGALIGGFQWTRLSFWGLFGVSNIQANPLFYALVDFATFFAVFGIIFLIMQLIAIRDFSYARTELTGVMYLTLSFFVSLIFFLIWTGGTQLLNGRQLFPYIGIIAPLLATGFIEMTWWLLFLLSPPDRHFVRAGEAVPEPVLREGIYWPLRFLGFAAVLVPFFVILPQYQAPEPLERRPNAALPVYAQYADIELIGYHHNDRRYIPGEPVSLTFYWRVREQTENDHRVTLALVDADGDEIGKIDTYPGGGRLRTTQWQPGAIYADDYVIPLDTDVEESQTFGVHIRWWDDESDISVIPTSGDSTLEAVILDVGAIVPLRADIENGGFQPFPVPDSNINSVTFDNRFRLTSYYVDFMTYELLITWQATDYIDEDYTTFAHVVNDDNELVTQADVYPQLPTHYWRQGEEFVISYPLRFLPHLDPGTYSLHIGWYNNNGTDLPRLDLILDPPTALSPTDPETGDIIGDPVQLNYYPLFEALQVDEEGDIFIPGYTDVEAFVTPTAEVTNDMGAEDAATPTGMVDETEDMPAGDTEAEANNTGASDDEGETNGNNDESADTTGN